MAIVALLIVLLAGAAATCSGQEPNAAPPTTNAPIKSLGNGLFELSQVKFNKTERWVSFSAVLNMEAGLLEYALVTTTGKVHESLLRTETKPHQIHLAMLLLGAKTAGTNSFPEDPTKPLPGDKVTVEVNWQSSKGKKQHRWLEDMVYNQQTRSSLRKGPWVYNGSLTIEGTFVAEQDGSIVTLITDPAAMINNPRQGRDDDEIWQVNTNGLPPLNVPLEVRLTLQ